MLVNGPEDVNLLLLDGGSGLATELLLDLSWFELFLAMMHRKVLEQVKWRTSLNLVP